MTVLALISLAIIATYTVVVICKQGGVPDSVSATFYRLEHKKAFTAVILLTGFTLLPPMLEASPENVQWLSFLTCAGFLAVGASPYYHEEFEGKVHTTGATVLLAASQAWVAFACPWLLLLWLLPLSWIAYNHAKYMDWQRAKPLLWVEATAIASGYGALLISL